MRISDWSSDVCSSDLLLHHAGEFQQFFLRHSASDLNGIPGARQRRRVIMLRRDRRGPEHARAGAENQAWVSREPGPKSGTQAEQGAEYLVLDVDPDRRPETGRAYGGERVGQELEN